MSGFLLFLQLLFELQALFDIENLVNKIHAGSQT